MPGWKEISDFVLKYDYCCGCGVCAGVCPQNALEICFNDYGEYKPRLVGKCVDCGLCSKVCPFVSGNPNEDDIGKAKFASVEGVKHRPETGYYLDTYIGYAADPGTRWNGASGGLTTWLLCSLLKRNLVDSVITVAPNGDPQKLFEYRILDNLEDVKACAKSAYYPVELSKIVKFILRNDRRCAIVGLPCFVKAIELACLHVPPLRNRILYKVGLVCGHLCSAHFTEYLLRLGNVDAERVREVSFREKELDKPANVYLFKSFGEAKTELSKVYAHAGYMGAYAGGYFKLNACDYCDDVFAELADICLMDAWLPASIKDSRGTNLLLIRTPSANDVLKQAATESTVCVQSIGIQSVVRAQRNALTEKRHLLAKRLRLYSDRGRQVPAKRTERACRLGWGETVSLLLAEKIKWRSREAFSCQKRNSGSATGLDDFNRTMRFWRAVQRPANYARMLRRRAGRVYGRLTRKTCDA
jgi:coenzyme F420 hydrogenase subunit beta